MRKTLYGELESIQLVKLHLASGKVSFLGYENFDAEPLPRLIERIKVDLWNQRVRFYDYVDDDGRHSCTGSPNLFQRLSCIIKSRRRLMRT